MPTPPWRRSSIWRGEGRMALVEAVGWVEHLRNPSTTPTKVMGIASLNPSYELRTAPSFRCFASPRNDGVLVNPHLPGFPAQHRLLAGDAPVIAVQRAALAERAVAGDYERHRIFSDRRADRA